VPRSEDEDEEFMENGEVLTPTDVADAGTDIENDATETE